MLRVERIDVSAPPRIRLFVTQVGQDGQVGRPPAPAALKLIVDGQALITPELKVGTVKSVGEPLAVTFVLQASSGMEAAFAEAQRSLVEIGDGLPPGSAVGLVAFTNTVHTALDPQPFAQVRGELERLTLDANAIETQLGIGVLRGLEGLKGPKAVSLPARRVLLVVAEGLTSSYERTEFTSLASRAKDNGVRINAVGFYKFGEPEQPTLALLTSLSKGTLRAYADPAGVRDGLKAAGAELSGQWVVDLDQGRLFDGIRHDFQLELDTGQASEVERAVLPVSNVGRSVDLRPVLFGGAAVALVAIIGAGAFLYSRKRKTEAQKLINNLQRPSLNVDMTAPLNAREVQSALRQMAVPVPAHSGPVDLRAPAKSEDLEDATIEAAPVASPVLALPYLDDTVPPPIMNPDQGGMALPSPSMFLKRVDLGLEVKLPSIIAPPEPPAFSNIPDDITAPSSPAVKQAPASFDPSEVEPRSMRDAPAQADLPSPRPPKLRGVQNARVDSGAMMLKTQLLAPSERVSSENVAWLVRLASPPVTIPLVPGHKVRGWTFNLDGLGRWVLAGGERVKILADREMVDLDGEPFIVMQATRVRSAPSSKDGVLLLFGGPDDGRVVTIAPGQACLVGAHPSADVRVRSKQVAPQHVIVRLESGKLTVADLGTSDGFKVDGEQLWRASLTPGQELHLGNVRLVFQRA